MCTCYVSQVEVKTAENPKPKGYRNGPGESSPHTMLCTDCCEVQGCMVVVLLVEGFTMALVAKATNRTIDKWPSSHPATTIVSHLHVMLW